MNESERWIVKCEDAKDGSGDVLVDLPEELLSILGLGIGDDLMITVENGEIVLKPVRIVEAGRSALAKILRDDVYHAYRVRLQKFLDLPPDASDQNIHSLIEAGFSANLIKALFETGVLIPEDSHRIFPLRLLIDKLADGQSLGAEESDWLFRFAHINALAEVIFGDAGKARHWLSTSKLSFMGRSPMEMLSTFLGTHQVEEMLIQIAEGLSF